MLLFPVGGVHVNLDLVQYVTYRSNPDAIELRLVDGTTKVAIPQTTDFPKLQSILKSKES